MGRNLAAKKGLLPIARLAGYSVADVDSAVMGMVPGSAVKKLLKNAAISKNDIDIWEIIEVFAEQALVVVEELQIDPQKVNSNGSGN